MSRDGAGHFIAAGYRLAAHDVNEGRGGEYRLGDRRCLSCDREHPVGMIEDGWCLQCNASSSEDLTRRLNERSREAARRARAALDSNPAVTRARDAADRYILKQRT